MQRGGGRVNSSSASERPDASFSSYIQKGTKRGVGIESAAVGDKNLFPLSGTGRRENGVERGVSM